MADYSSIYCKSNAIHASVMATSPTLLDISWHRLSSLQFNLKANRVNYNATKWEVHIATILSYPYKDLTNSCRFACSLSGKIYMYAVSDRLYSVSTSYW